MAEKEVKTFSHSHNLEQYVLLAKSARGAGLVALINQTLEAPGVYVFGELIEMPSVKAVCMCTRLYCRTSLILLSSLCLNRLMYTVMI